MLPTTDIIERLVAKISSGSSHPEFFGDSYRRTLAEWHRRFQESWPFIEALDLTIALNGYGEYYLAYCQLRNSNRRPECSSLYKLKQAMFIIR